MSSTPNLFPDLILAHQHPLSLQLAAQASELAGSLPNGVVSCVVTAPGIVDLTLQPTTDRDLQQGYGTRTWLFRVGGAGIGDKPELAAMFGGDARSPVAARFAVRLAV